MASNDDCFPSLDGTNELRQANFGFDDKVIHVAQL